MPRPALAGADADRHDVVHGHARARTHRMIEKRDTGVSEAIQDETLQAPVAIARSRRASPAGPRYHAVITARDGAKSLHPLPAFGDDEAIAQALALAEGRVIEVWDGPRLIERFNAVTW